MNDFKNWLLNKLDELSHPNPDETMLEWFASFPGEAGDIAARLGYVDLYEKSLTVGGSPRSVKAFLASCLAALPESEATYLTESEAIAYLRLNIDGRDPKERLRNLVRRQGLPRVRKGKVILYPRQKIDEWLLRRN